MKKYIRKHSKEETRNATELLKEMSSRMITGMKRIFITTPSRGNNRRFRKRKELTRE